MLMGALSPDFHRLSISPTFYEQLLRTKVKRAAFLYVQLRLFKHFWCMKIDRKARRKMLVKLSSGEKIISLAHIHYQRPTLGPTREQKPRVRS